MSFDLKQTPVKVLAEQLQLFQLLKGVILVLAQGELEDRKVPKTQRK